jgi:putative oxidoreductase
MAASGATATNNQWEIVMSAMGRGEPKLLFPGLAGFYSAVSDLWYPMIRITVGAILLVHGWGKIKTGITGLAGYLGRVGLTPPEPLAYVAYINETIGALCIILGLFTRFFAASIAIELAVALWIVHYAKGFGASAGGYEYVLMWGIIMFAIALRGGGPYSLDRVIGKEL